MDEKAHRWQALWRELDGARACVLRRIKRWGYMLLVAAALLGIGFGSVPVGAIRASEGSAAAIYSSAGSYAEQYQALSAYVLAAGRPHRVVQAGALDVKISQYYDIDSSGSGYGPNACGLVAAAAALGGDHWVDLAGQIRAAAGDNYDPWTGIQPSPYAAALKKVFGTGNVSSGSNQTLLDLYRDLSAGNAVIVDMQVNANWDVPSTDPPNYAHFARVIGMDIDRQEIYIQNTLLGGPYWTISLQQFLQVWSRPETAASLIPDPQHAEDVNQWAVVINGKLEPAQPPS